VEGFKNGQARDSEERLVEPIEGDGKKPPRLMPGVGRSRYAAEKKLK